MYVSRLTFHTLPGKTQEAEDKLSVLRRWVEEIGGMNPRVMRTHYGSLGAPDLVFEQEVKDPAMLEEQIQKHANRCIAAFLRAYAPRASPRRARRAPR